MGKFKTLIESEQARKKYRKLEAALHHAGFTHGPGSRCWERRMHAEDGTLVRASLSLDTDLLCIHGNAGLLCVHGNSADGDYGVPESIIKNDDADALLSWLDEKLEEWL